MFPGSNVKTVLTNASSRQCDKVNCLQLINAKGSRVHLTFLKGSFRKDLLLLRKGVQLLCRQGLTGLYIASLFQTSVRL